MSTNYFFLMPSSHNTYLSFFALLLSTITFGQTNLALKSSVDRVQPMTGIVFWADNSSDLNTLGDKTQLEYSYLIYADVVENKGVYDWGVVDNLLSKAASRGRQVILRFRYTYPGETAPSVPQYIRNRSDYKDRTENVEGSNTYIPDWSNETLEDFTLEFFTKFAARYDNDARLAYVQVGFGSYSEYHLYDGNLRFGDTFPTKAYQTTFLKHIDSVFKETQWAISIDAGAGAYTPIASSNELLNLGYGLFDDSFLHESHSTNNQEYNRSSWLTFGANRANTRAAGGELNYYSQKDQETVLNVAGPYGFTFEEMAAMYDISYMIGNDQLNYQSPSRIEDAGMATGYHYQVTSYATGGNTTSVTIKNNGIAPIYYDAYPTVNGTRSSTSLKGLIAGQSRKFTINALPNSKGLTIECDRLVAGQEIQYDANLEGGVVTTNTTLSLAEVATFAATGGSQTTTISSNVSWTASEHSSWISINKTSGSNTGSISITATANTSSSARSAVLTVTGGGLTKTITLQQSGAAIVTTSYTSIPAKIEAEDYSTQSGILWEDTADVGGGENAGWIAANDYLAYNIKVPASGDYTIDFRVASLKNGAKFDIYQGTAKIGTIAEAATGGWQNWTTATTTVTLASGNQTLKIIATDKNWNINWLQIKTAASLSSDNIAIEGIATQSSIGWSGAPSRAIDGNTNGAYSKRSVTHTAPEDSAWWQVKLPNATTIGTIVIYNRTDSCCMERLLNFTVLIKDSNNITTYSKKFTSYPDPSLTITTGGVLGQTVRIRSNLSNTALSLAEVEVYQGTGHTGNSCSAGANLAATAAIVTYSAQQNTTNGVVNAFDGTANNRWSASGFPQAVVIDLGAIYAVDQVNLYPYKDRAYQFTVQGSATSPDNGYKTMKDATNNTVGGSVITRTFDTYDVRYVKLTITGASGYTGIWSSIADFEVLCAGGAGAKSDSVATTTAISMYPNPVADILNIAIKGTATQLNLYSLTGKLLHISSLQSGNNTIDISELPKGVYFAYVVSPNTAVTQIEKIIKN